MQLILRSCWGSWELTSSPMLWSKKKCSCFRRDALWRWSLQPKMYEKSSSSSSSKDQCSQRNLCDFWCFIHKLWLFKVLTKTGLVVLVLSEETTWPLKSYSWYMDFTNAPRDSCQAVLHCSCILLGKDSLCHIFSNAKYFCIGLSRFLTLLRQKSSCWTLLISLCQAARHSEGSSCSLVFVVWKNGTRNPVLLNT